MNARTIFCRALLLCLALPVASLAQQPLVNGAFESFQPNGVPTGWNFISLSPANLIGPSALVSPFTSPLGPSTASVLITDDPGETSVPRLEQTFATVNDGFHLSYDFQLGGPTLAGGNWALSFLSTFQGGASWNLIGVSMDNAGQFRVTRDNFSPSLIVATLAPSTWYHVEINASFLTGMHSGSITPFGGLPMTWSNHSFLNTLPAHQNLATIQFSDLGDGIINSPLYLDNVFLQPVPEPSTWALVIGGALLFGGRAVRKHFHNRTK